MTGQDRPPIYAAMLAEYGDPSDPPRYTVKVTRKPRKARKPARRKAQR